MVYRYSKPSGNDLSLRNQLYVDLLESIHMYVHVLDNITYNIYAPVQLLSNCRTMTDWCEKNKSPCSYAFFAVGKEYEIMY